MYDTMLVMGVIYTVADSGLQASSLVFCYLFILYSYYLRVSMRHALNNIYKTYIYTVDY